MNKSGIHILYNEKDVSLSDLPEGKRLVMRYGSLIYNGLGREINDRIIGIVYGNKKIPALNTIELTDYVEGDDRNGRVA